MKRGPPNLRQGIFGFFSPDHFCHTLSVYRIVLSSFFYKFLYALGLKICVLPPLAELCSFLAWSSLWNISCSASACSLAIAPNPYPGPLHSRWNLPRSLSFVSCSSLTGWDICDTRRCKCDGPVMSTSYVVLRIWNSFNIHEMFFSPLSLSHL